MVAIPTRSPVNEPGPAATANRSIGREADVMTREQIDDVTRQTLAVASRAGPDPFLEQRGVARERDAARPARRVDRKNQHVDSLCAAWNGRSAVDR